MMSMKKFAYRLGLLLAVLLVAVAIASCSSLPDSATLLGFHVETQTDIAPSPTPDTAQSTAPDTAPDEASATLPQSSDAATATPDIDTAAPETVHSHAFGAWQVTREPTCTDTGVAVRYCSCGAENVQTVEAAGHTPVIQEAVSPSCSRTGLTEGSYCEVCRLILSRQTELPKLGHQYESGTCKLCGAVDWSQIDMADLNAYAGTYGYEALAEQENGAALQQLYRDMDREASVFHISAGLDLTEETAMTLDYGALGLSDTEAMAVWTTYRSDHPLYYWLSNQIMSGGGQLTLMVDEAYAEGAVRAACNDRIYEAVRQYVSRIDPTDDAYRKALACHDMIIEAIDYAYADDGQPETAAWAHNILGVLEGQGAVCEGYAKTFQLLLNYLGVENLVASGTANGGGHAWNLVRLDDGNWYWCDVTWDDIGGSPDPETPRYRERGVRYNYFCVIDTTDTSGSRGGSWSSGAETFVGGHICDPTTTAAAGVDFQYALPARATQAYADEARPLVQDAFEVENCRYTVVGYNAVELSQITGTGTVRIPEVVTYRDVTYTVVSLGAGERLDESVLGEGITSVFIPKTVSFIWDGALYLSTLESIEVDAENPYFCSRDGVLFTSALYTLIAYPPASARTEYRVPDGTVDIAYLAFNHCRNLVTLTLGKDVSDLNVTNSGCGYREGATAQTPANHGVIVKGVWGGSIAWVEVVEDNPWYVSDDGILCDRESNETVWLPQSHS